MSSITNTQPMKLHQTKEHTDLPDQEKRDKRWKISEHWQNDAVWDQSKDRS